MWVWFIGIALAGPRLLTPEEQREDLEFMHEQLLAYHPSVHVYQDGAALKAVVQQAIAASSEPQSYYRFMGVAKTVTASIGCSHTTIELSKKLNRKFYSESGFIPLDFWLEGDRLFMDPRVHESASEVLSINGTPAKEILGDLRARVNTDGKRREGKDVRLADELSDYYALMTGYDDVFDVEIKAGDKTEVVQFQGVEYDDVPYETESVYSSLSEVAPKVIYWRFDDFSHDHLEHFIAKVFPKILEAQAVIIDLRENSGGNAYAENQIIRHFVFENYHGAEDMAMTPKAAEGSSFDQAQAIELRDDNLYHMKPDHKLHDMALYRNQEPAPTVYSGPLYMLIGGGSQSAGATFPNLLSRQERTVLIGVETGGGSILQTAGGMKTFKLPNSGLVLFVPLSRGVFAGDASSFGRGVIPDVVVPTTIDDLSASRDPVLECAKALATGGSCKERGTGAD